MMELIKNKRFKKAGLIIIRHTGHLNHLKNIIETLHDSEFIITSNFVDEWSFYKNNISKLSNLTWVDDKDLLLAKVSSFDFLMVFDGLYVQSHENTLIFIKEAQEFKIPVYEIQHGLFQISINAYHQPSKNNFFDESLITRPASDILLSWFDTASGTTIGYPPYNKTQPISSFNPPKPLVSIFTNLHWQAYSRIGRIRILSDLMKFIIAHPNIQFYWKKHHGEAASGLVQEDIKLVEGIFGIEIAKFENLMFIEFDIDPERLVSISSHCICTASSVLLDIELHKKKCALIIDETTANLVKDFQSYSIFNTSSSLDTFKNIQSGLLMPFNEKALRSAIYSE